MRTSWTIVTGEYPPTLGGVADYSRIVAESLAGAGDEVAVVAPGPTREFDRGVVPVHRVAHGYTPAGLFEFMRIVRTLPGRRRILVQYVPQAYGLRGINVPFIMALSGLREAGELWVMYHEFAIAHDPSQSAPRQLQARITRFMAAYLARAASRVFVSTELWLPMVKIAAPNVRVDVVPIPSNIPTSADPVSSTIVRKTLPSALKRFVGHFGTYRMEETRTSLRELAPLLLADDFEVGLLLMGNGSDEFAAAMRARYPALANRIVGTGALDPSAVADRLRLCDVLIQPYAEGVTTRRGSLLAGLALGVPIVTTLGPSSERIWRDSDAVLTFEAGDHSRVVCAVREILESEHLRLKLSEAGKRLYRDHFAIEHTIEVLRAEMP